MIDYFNTTVPESFEYRKLESDDSVCALTSKNGGAFQMMSFKPKLTERQKKMLNGEITPAAIDKLLGIALEEIEFDGSDAILNLGSDRLQGKYLIRTVDDDQMAGNGKMLARRNPLRCNMPLTCNNTHIDVPLVQKPSGSIDTLNFASEGGALSIQISGNVTNHVVSYKCDFKNENEPDAKKCLAAATIVDGIRMGKTIIDGFGTINQTVEEDSGRGIASFWKWVVEVEEALGITFQTNRMLDKATIANIERLHRCICEEKAVGLGFKPDTITMRTSGEAPTFEDVPCRILFPRWENLTIFGRLYKIYSNVGLQGIILGHPEQIDREQFQIPITYADDYQCSILYLSTSSEGRSDREIVKGASEIMFTPLPDGRRY